MLGADDLYYRVAITGPGATHDLSEALSSVVVEEDEGAPTALRASFADEHTVLTDALHEGVEIEVDIGTASDHSLVFRGRVYHVEADLPHRGIGKVEVRAYDAAMRMGLQRRNRTWQGPLSGVVSEIAAGYKFADRAVDLVGDPAFERNGVRQHDETDLAFLRRLATDHGCVCHVTADDDGDRFHFRARARIAEEEPDATLSYRHPGAQRGLLRFGPRSDVADVDLPRQMSAIDYDTGQQGIETTSEPDPAAPGLPSPDARLAGIGQDDAGTVRAGLLDDLVDSLLTAAVPTSERLRAELGSSVPRGVPPFLSREALNARAANAFSASRRGMRASGATVGDAILRAARNVEIEGVGDHFSGTWYLTSVRHRLDARGFRTDFEASR